MRKRIGRFPATHTIYANIDRTKRRALFKSSSISSLAMGIARGASKKSSTNSKPTQRTYDAENHPDSRHFGTCDRSCVQKPLWSRYRPRSQSKRHHRKTKIKDLADRRLLHPLRQRSIRLGVYRSQIQKPLQAGWDGLKDRLFAMDALAVS